MIRENEKNVASAARELYEERLRELLEPAHNDEFVAIEPISGGWFAIGTQHLQLRD